MKRIAGAVLMLSLFSMGMGSCAKDELTTKMETVTATPPGGQTTTTEKDVKQTGENPPPARP